MKEPNVAMYAAGKMKYLISADVSFSAAFWFNLKKRRHALQTFKVEKNDASKSAVGNRKAYNSSSYIRHSTIRKFVEIYL